MKVGDLYGAWEVVELLPKARVLCKCTACGNAVQTMKRSDLAAGATRMCRSCSRGTHKARTEDEKIKEVYMSWTSMLQRCYNKSNKDYKNYGARGIGVADIWRDSFDAFYLMMGPRPSPDCTLERLDYDKGYEPGNVVWLPRSEQPFNQRSNVNLTIDGETKVVTQWAKDPRCSVSHFVIYKRLERGWPPKAAVFAPAGTRLKDWVG